MFAQKFITNSESKLTLWDNSGHMENYNVISEKIKVIEETYPNKVNVIKDKIIDKTILSAQNLLLVSSSSWESFVIAKNTWLSDIPSTLIIKVN